MSDLVGSCYWSHVEHRITSNIEIKQYTCMLNWYPTMVSSHVLM